MKLIGNVRLGRDAELRYTATGTPVATLFGAYKYGKKGESGKRLTQWVEATLWGQQAESLADYLKKGEQFLLTMNEVHVQTYDKLDGTPGVKLTGTVKDIDFVAGPVRRDEPLAWPQAGSPASVALRQKTLPLPSASYDDAQELPF